MKFNFTPSCAKLILLCAVTLAGTEAASAYTVVLRSGARVQVPDEFRLTDATLTYVIAPNINRTILLNAVDFAATERANGEPAGSLRRRIAAALDSARREAETNAPVRARGEGEPRRDRTPTLTTGDLEGLRRRNHSKRQAYEVQRQELPPASDEEREEEADGRRRLLRELDRRDAEQTAQTESLFRARAQELRAEFAETNAELNYWRGRLAQVTNNSLTSLAAPATTLVGIPPVAYPYNFGLPVVGFPNLGVFGTGAFGTGTFGTGVFGTGGVSTTTVASGLGVNLGVGLGGSGGGGVRGGVALGGGFVRGAARVRARGFGGFQPFFGFPFPVPFGANGFGIDDITRLRDRIRELEVVRGRLTVRERILQDEARRAGVAPGVLRP